MRNILDLSNFFPLLQMVGLVRFVTRYKTLIWLTVNLILYSGWGLSLDGNNIKDPLF